MCQRLRVRRIADVNVLLLEKREERGWQYCGLEAGAKPLLPLDPTNPYSSSEGTCTPAGLGSSCVSHKKSKLAQPV